jgi:co-chaperonin GroES (HSP10)
MIRMLDDRILIDPDETSDINPGGIVYVGSPTTTFTTDPGTAKQVCMGRVVSVGPGKRHPKTGRRHAPDVDVGEYVAFSDTCHRPCDDYLMIREGDIIGKSALPIEHVQVNY